MKTRIGFVGTYPPTLCGIATFTSSLVSHLTARDDVTARVIRLVDSPQQAAPGVLRELVADDPASMMRSAAELNACDMAIIQHEYGIYGGPDGDQILALLGALTVPSIVVLHTVLSAPTPNQKAVLEKVVSRANAVVTMTTTARDRLAAGYDADLRKVRVIPHGASAPVVSHGLSFRTTQPTILTWGLIGPGKGIEWGIAAMGRLGDLTPAPRYLVAGQTHPKVLAREGETYRHGLQRQTRDLGLTATVTLDGYYRHTQALAELVASADVVLLPYDSTEQVTSGVLIEAVAALKPVVATRFPHAVELLTDDLGILVPHRDPDAIAGALRTLLTSREVTAGKTRAAAVTAPELLWPNVARRYLDIGCQLVEARVAA